MSIGLYRIGYILKSPLDNCASDHFGGAQLDTVAWCFLHIAHFLHYGDIVRQAAGSRSRGNKHTFLDPSSKLQAASLEHRVIHSPVNNYDFKFDICRMILYNHHCQLCPICCWFSLYWHNVSARRV